MLIDQSIMSGANSAEVALDTTDSDNIGGVLSDLPLEFMTNTTTIEDILRQIKCDDHIDIFQDHQLDLNSAILLGDEEIKELFPKIGQRIKFKNKIQELKNKLAESTPQTPNKDFMTELPITYQDSYRLIPESEGSENTDATSKTHAILYTLENDDNIANTDDITFQKENNRLNIQEHLSWLKNNVEPWDTVQKNWPETEAYRLNKVKADEGRIEDYFNDFPALQQQQGYTLVRSSA